MTDFSQVSNKLPHVFLVCRIKRILNSANHQQLALGLMLLTLHSVLLLGFDTPVYKAILICHYGFFLVWQPVWRTQEKLSWFSAILFLAGGALMFAFVSWWFIALWLACLFGLLGGRVFSAMAKATHRNYLLAAGYVLTMLIIWIVPKLVQASEEISAADVVVRYVMPIPLVYILFARVKTEESKNPPVLDFFYTLLLILSAVIFVLASFAIGASSQASYTEIIVKVVFGLAFALLILSWLWSPHAGFSGIGQLVSRYLLSVGLPFERWLENIAALADQETSSKAFTQSAMRELAALPWVKGIKWTNDEDCGELGTVTGNQIEMTFHGFHLRLYSHWRLTPALMLHIKLLVQIMGEFYEAKRREETLQQNLYVQAVYETGSRLTHDIKNLVQSIGTLCQAAEETRDEDSSQLLALMRRQLPVLNRRLALTLDKLQAPAIEEYKSAPLGEWWKGLKARYALQTNIKFSVAEWIEKEVKAEVLDSIVDNLLQNAIRKSKTEQDLRIEVELVSGDDFYVDVRDNGKPMPANVADILFRKYVSSEGGLGVGLHHAARQARQSGYTLELIENRDGEVRFRISQTRT